ncbi:MAG: DUF362 domain-containing protein [Actinomycetota bacterium]
MFLKVNALMPYEPEKMVTTHPEVVRAVVLQLDGIAGSVTIGDSPGGPFTPSFLKRFYDKAGFARVAEETGADLGYDTGVMHVKVPDAGVMKVVPVCGAMVKADRLINLPKFKTHMFMNITGAVKNLFGAVPGMYKLSFHSRFHKDGDFANLLVDAALAADADLHIVDAVVGQDRNGPRAGDIKPMGVIAAGPDAFAVDSAMMAVIGKTPKANKPLAAAMSRGLTAGDLSDVELLGDSVEDLAVQGFRMPDKKDIAEYVPEFIMQRFGSMMSLRPRPAEGRCTGCGKCAELCPAGAITVEGRLARVDLKKCLRCYCCHELCEFDAVELDRPLLLRLVRARG